MERDVLTARCASLPIFPLPRLVVMPREIVPLHVFEPRYRELVAHCMQGDRLLGMATLKPGFEGAYEGRPALFSAVAIVEIVRHQALPDGRSNIVVEWQARADLVEEIPSEALFRRVRVQIREDIDDLEDPGPIRALVRQLGGYSETAAQEAARLAAMAGPEMVDQIARRLIDDPEDRLAYVGMDSVGKRAAMLEERLAGLIGRGTAAGDA